MVDLAAAEVWVGEGMATLHANATSLSPTIAWSRAANLAVTAGMAAVVALARA